jgi:hypothetical protein
MAKRRFQDPELELVGKWWQIRIYQDEEDQKTKTNPAGAGNHADTRSPEAQGRVPSTHESGVDF